MENRGGVHAWETKGLINSLKKKSYEGDCKLLQSFLEYNPNAKLLDVGCSDGYYTKQFAESIGTQDVVGMDIKDWGCPFKLVSGNIEEGLPFGDGSFDVIIASNIIEHLSNTDLFVKELYRVLRKGGYSIIATPNLACGRVIVELLLNRQPRQAHVSDLFTIRKDYTRGWKNGPDLLHRRLFTMEGLVRLLTFHGFKVERRLQSGYGAFFFLKILRGKYASNLLVKAGK